MFMKTEQKRIVTSVVGRFFEILFFFIFFSIDSAREVMSRPSDVSHKLDGSFKVCSFISFVGIPVTQESP